jgi:hypothetical protein
MKQQNQKIYVSYKGHRTADGKLDACLSSCNRRRSLRESQSFQRQMG